MRVCSPRLVHRALSADLDTGLLLPCNVVYEDDGDSVVGILDPLSMLALVDNAKLVPVAAEARKRLERVVAALTD